jgi:hypothetical protein
MYQHEADTFLYIYSTPCKFVHKNGYTKNELEALRENDYDSVTL